MVGEGGAISDPIEYIQAIYSILRNADLNLDTILELIRNIELGEMINDYAKLKRIRSEFGPTVKRILLERGLNEDVIRAQYVRPIWLAFVRNEQYKKFSKETQMAKYLEIAGHFNAAFLSADPHGEAVNVANGVRHDFNMFIHGFHHYPVELYERIMRDVAIPEVIFDMSDREKQKMFVVANRIYRGLRARGLCLCVMELIWILEKINRRRIEGS